MCSTNLLQRRPDIAAGSASYRRRECQRRRGAGGVFPSITLNGVYGFESNRSSELADGAERRLVGRA